MNSCHVLTFPHNGNAIRFFLPPKRSVVKSNEKFKKNKIESDEFAHMCTCI